MPKIPWRRTRSICEDARLQPKGASAAHGLLTTADVHLQQRNRSIGFHCLLAGGGYRDAQPSLFRIVLAESRRMSTG